jgi:lipopolysaccharide transport system ATP-binding protein
MPYPVKEWPLTRSKYNMALDTLLSIENVSKKYCYSLKQSLRYGLKDIAAEVVGRTRSHELRSQEFWALKAINLKVKMGESIGLIGANGSGKSTLLKLINGLIKPDSGKITVRGNVGALIQLGVGFNPILTGRENIYVNAAVLGFKRKHVDSILEEIVDFCELPKFIDTPVKFYSSGMKMRLGFAVAAQLNPDLLLVDEVLAVGDFAFRNKCLTRLNKMKTDGASFILVSHNHTSIIQFCKRVIWLDKSQVRIDGEPVTVCSEYLSESKKARTSTSLYGDTITNKEILQSVDVQISDGQTGKPISTVVMGSEILIHYCFKTRRNLESPNISFPIYREDGLLVTTVASLGRASNFSWKNGRYLGVVKVGPVNLAPGNYTMVANLHDGMEYVTRTAVINFKIDSPTNSTTWGLMSLEQDWSFGNADMESSK